MTNEKNIENYEVPKLSIKQVLKESIGIYKSSFKAFIMLSAIIFIINFGSEIINYLDKLFKSYTYVKLLFTLINLVYPFVSIYVYSKINMAIYMLSEKVSNGAKITARKAYTETKGLFWRFFGVTIQYGLILALPAIAIFSVSYRFKESSVIKYAVIALLLIPLLYLTVKYYFAIISATLKKEEHQYLQKSKLLVAGDFWTILFLIIVSNVVFQVSSFIFLNVFDSKNTIELNKLIISSIREILFILITPFTHIVTTVMYLTLKRNKNID